MDQDNILLSSSLPGPGDSDTDYRQVFDLNPQPMWVYDTETLAFLAINQAAIKRFGFSGSEFHQKTIRDIPPPPARDTLFQPLIFQGRPAVQVTLTEIGELDLDEHKFRYVSRALQTLGECTKVLVSSTTEAALLHNICQVIVSQGGYRLAWVGMAQDNAERSVLPVASAGFESGYLESIHVSWADNVFGQGPTGRSIRSGLPVIARNISVEQSYEPWRSQAQQRGYASSIGLPLSANARVFGNLNIYAAELDAFSDDEVKLLLRLGDQLSLGVTSLRAQFEGRLARTALLESEERFRSAFFNAPIGMALIGLDNHILQVNRALCEILGYAEEHLLSTTIDAITYPGDVEKAQQPKHMALQGGPANFKVEQRYLHANGQTVWGQFSVSLVRDGNGQPLYYLGQLEDITRRKQDFEALQNSEQRYRTLFASARRQAQELALLDKARTALARHLELPVLFRTVVEAIVETFGYTLVSIYMCQEDWLVLQYQVGYASVFERIPLNQGISGRVVRTAQAVLLTNARQDPAFLGAMEGIHSEVCVPLIDLGQVVGILNVESTQGLELNEADLRLMTALGEHVGIAIGRARMYTSIRESEERYARAVQGANDGLWDWDLVKQEVYYSPRWKSILGFQDGEISSSIDEWFLRIHPDDQPRVHRDLTAHLEGGAPNFENEHRVRDAQKTDRWVLVRGVAVRSSEGVALRMAGSMTDITQRKRAEAQLLHDAFHDALTGLPNRALFHDRLEHVLQHTKRYSDYQFAVLYLDLDQFKMINDSLGHTAGDQILITIARRLEACLRPSDTFARQGGDEFVILLENVSALEEAVAVADRVLEQLAQPMILNGRQVFTSASIGIVWSAVGKYQNPEEVMRDADIAMYRAKALDKSCFQVFDVQMREGILSRLALEADLRRAIGNRELVVYYHPIISLHTNALQGFEALVRWLPPNKQVIYPKDFVPLAEESLLIVPIDRWVMQESCNQMYQWSQRFPTSPPLILNVNFSSKQFSRLDLIETVIETLKSSGLPGAQVRVEITESVVMANIDYAVSILNKLHALGIKVCIDDFGTGYSSLSYLFQLPVDTLKIDRSFIERLDKGEGAEIVHAIIDLAHNLGMEVIAEGVETATQLECLRKLGSDCIQGYFISRPIPADEIEDFIKTYTNPKNVL